MNQPEFIKLNLKYSQTIKRERIDLSNKYKSRVLATKVVVLSMKEANKNLTKAQDTAERTNEGISDRK